jgi:hypothetical protein
MSFYYLLVWTRIQPLGLRWRSPREGVSAMFVLARAATYSALFIGFLLVFLPDRILSSTGIIQPDSIGAWQLAGMVLAAGLALSGAALFYRSVPLLGYAGLFLLMTHLFVVWYEEPTLRRTFDRDYEAYCRRVGRWWPTR